MGLPEQMNGCYFDETRVETLTVTTMSARKLPAKTKRTSGRGGAVSRPRKTKYEITAVFRDPGFEEVEGRYDEQGNPALIPDNDQLVTIMYNEACAKDPSMKARIRFLDANVVKELPREVDQVPKLYNAATKHWSPAGDKSVEDMHAWLNDNGVFIDLRAHLYGEGPEAEHQVMSEAYKAEERSYREGRKRPSGRPGRRGRGCRPKEEQEEAPPQGTGGGAMVDRRGAGRNRRPRLGERGRSALGHQGEEEEEGSEAEDSGTLAGMRREVADGSEHDVYDTTTKVVDVHGEKRERKIKRRLPGRPRGELMRPVHQLRASDGSHAAAKAKGGKGYRAHRSEAPGAQVQPSMSRRIDPRRGVVRVKDSIVDGEVKRPKRKRTRSDAPPERVMDVETWNDTDVVEIDEEAEQAEIKARMEARAAQLERAKKRTGSASSRRGEGGVEESKADPGTYGDYSDDYGSEGDEEGDYSTEGEED